MSRDERRREFLAKVSGGLAILTAAGAVGRVSPAEARSQGKGLRKLTDDEARTLEALGDVLLPGAAVAGIAEYVDSQLASPTPLLFLKYMDYPEPFLDFYREGLSSLEALTMTRHAQRFHELNLPSQIELVREISRENPSGWDGPPSRLFYFVVRNDAVDVYYGTQRGFAKLNVPYMPHIVPPADW